MNNFSSLTWKLMIYNHGHNIHNILRLFIFEQIFLSPQVKWIAIIINKHGLCEIPQKTLFKTRDLSYYQPWRNVARGKRTCTANMCVAQDVQQENQSAAIDKKDITQVLHSRNLLRLAEKIPNLSQQEVCSVKCNTAQTMQTFCTEGLTISENSNIFFKPD